MTSTSKHTSLALPTPEEVQPLHCLEVRFDRETPLQERIERTNMLTNALRGCHNNLVLEARVLTHDLNTQDVATFFSQTDIAVMNVEVYAQYAETANNILFNLRSFFQIAGSANMAVNAHFLDWAHTHQMHPLFTQEVIQRLGEKGAQRIMLCDLTDRKCSASTQEAVEDVLYNTKSQPSVRIGYCASSYGLTGRSVQKMSSAQTAGVHTFHISIPSGRGGRHIPSFDMLGNSFTDGMELSATWDW